MLELVFMGAFPVGASNPPDFVSGAIISSAYVILTGQEVASAVVLAVPIATLVLIFDNFLMTVVLTWAAHIADRYAEQGNIEGVEWTLHIAAIGNSVLLPLMLAGLGIVRSINATAHESTTRKPPQILHLRGFINCAFRGSNPGPTD